MNDEVKAWNKAARALADQMLVAHTAMNKAWEKGDKELFRRWRTQYQRLHVQLAKMITNAPRGVTVPKPPK